MDTLELLRTFRDVAEQGSFSRAATRLGLAKATVSKYVAELEARLGVRLLNRTTRKVSLTEVGQAYYERTRQILGDLDEADRIADAMNSTPRGTLRIYANPSLVRFLSPVIAEFVAPSNGRRPTPVSACTLRHA